MSDEILTLPEVALLLKVAEKTIYTMAQKGEVPAFKVRGQWCFKSTDLDQWIEQQKVEKWLHSFGRWHEWIVCLTSRTVVCANQERR